MIQIVKGSTITIPFTVYTDTAKTVLADLTSSTIYLTAKERIDDTDANKLFEKAIGSGVTLVSPTAGTATATILPADTNAYSIKQFYFEIIVKLSGGSVIRTGWESVTVVNNTRKTLP